MKIFDNNLNAKSKTVNFKNNWTIINKGKYLPAYSKEWNNVIYSFNKNNLKNLPVNIININNIIQSYFRLFFNNHNFIDTKYWSLKKRRRVLKRIVVSNANIKFTTNKAKITLYTINQEKVALAKNYHKLNINIIQNIFTKFTYLYTKQIKNIGFDLRKKSLDLEWYLLKYDHIEKNMLTNCIVKYFKTYLKLENLFSKKLWNNLIKIESDKCFKSLRSYDLALSLNQFKFNKIKLLPKLTYLLEQLTGKKIQYNIVNLKSIIFHPDLFTKMLAFKLKKQQSGYKRHMASIINLCKLPTTLIREKGSISPSKRRDVFLNKYRDLKILNKNLYKFINIRTANTKSIHNLIFNSLNYKYLEGIKIKVSGRLTKRYRADKAIQEIQKKGGLKNYNSSYKQLNTVLYRGNTNANVNYSFVKSKRRVGSFAVKGWLGSI